MSDFLIHIVQVCGVPRPSKGVKVGKENVNTDGYLLEIIGIMDRRMYQMVQPTEWARAERARFVMPLVDALDAALGGRICLQINRLHKFRPAD